MADVSVAGLGWQELVIVVGLIAFMVAIVKGTEAILRAVGGHGKPSPSPVAVAANPTAAPVRAAPVAVAQPSPSVTGARCACGASNPAGSAYCGACGLSLTDACAKCGAVRDPGSRFCRACGTPYIAYVAPFGSGALHATAPLYAAPHAAPVPASPLIPAVRQRPTWVVVALMLLSVGSYFIVWFGQSWSELKKAARDPGMSPFWHALTLVVPFYNLFRVHAHFRTIREQRAGVGLSPSLTPWIAVVGVVIASVVLSISNRVDFTLAADIGRMTQQEVDSLVFLGLIIGLIGSLVSAAVAAAGQRGLNGIWEKAGAPRRAAPGEWFAVLLLLAVWVWLYGGEQILPLAQDAITSAR